MWTRIPKNVFVGYKTLQIGVSDAVITWNEGNIARIKVLQLLGIKAGDNTVNILQELDKLRVTKAEWAAQQMTKEARKKRRREKLCLHDDERSDNGAGCF